MAQVIVYHVHPSQRTSRVNAAMWARAGQVADITRVDLYADYPRFDIDVDREQKRLLAHDVIVFQFPLFWYSTPSLLKEWQDLVLEHGFAYGAGGHALDGKALQLAVTTAGPAEAYGAEGYQRYPIRDFLRPLEQTARLCHMTFPAPYVLFGALNAEETRQIEPHAAGYAALLARLRDAADLPGDAPGDAVLDHAALSALTKA